MDTEVAYGRAFATSAARPAAAKAAERAQVMPAQMVSMMSAYLANLSPADRAAFGRAFRELDKIKGHPISTRFEWLLDGNACGSKKDDAGPKPLLSFTVEVKQLGVLPVRDSTFSVPASYKLVKLP